MSTRRAQNAGDVALPVVNGPRTPRIRPSTMERRRFIVLGLVQLFLLIHVVHWLTSERTLSPLEPSESMEWVKQGVVNAGLILFALALLSTLVFGRWFCGWGCHVLLLQDGCSWVLKKLGLRPKPFRSRLLLIVPFMLAFYMFVMPAVHRWGLLPLDARLAGWLGADHGVVEAFRAVWTFLGFPLPAPGLVPWQTTMHLTTDSFWATFPGWVVGAITLVTCGFATVYVLGNKGFCTYGCPYGGFFAPLDQYAPGRIRVTDACEGCGHCTAVCSSNVRVHEEVAAYGMVVDPGCMKCMDCVSVCPNDALYFGFGKPAATRAPARGPEPKPVAALSTAEEIGCGVVFLVAFVGWRGLYGAVPMLMAAGLAGIITAVVWQAWRVIRDRNASFHRFRLRFHGSMRPAGIGFLGVTAVLVALTLHGLAVNVIGQVADFADGKVTMPRELIFAPAPLVMPAGMAPHAERALRAYEMVAPISHGGIAFAHHPGHLIRRAWLHMCRHEFGEAEARLREHIAVFGLSDAVATDLARTLRLQIREDDALAYARSTLEAHPEFQQLRDDTVLWMIELGMTQAAIDLAEAGLDAARDDAERLFALRRLSLLHTEHGDFLRGLELFRRTFEMDDTNPAAYVMYARALLRAGRTDEAVIALERAAALRPDDQSIRDELEAARGGG